MIFADSFVYNALGWITHSKWFFAIQSNTKLWFGNSSIINAHNV